MIGDETNTETTPTADVFGGEFERLAQMAAEAPSEEPPAPVETPPVEAAETPVEAAEAPVEAADTSEEAPEPEGEPTAANADASQSTVAASTADQTTDPKEDMLERLARLVAERDKQHEVPQEQRIEQPQAAPQAEPLYTNDEAEFLTNYEKEWPDVSRAEAIRRRAEYKQLVGYVFKEVANELRPILDVVRTLAESKQVNDLTQRVDNYAQDYQAVIDWVGKQPAYLQPAYRHVIQNGTVDEVADLFTRFRTETGAQRAAPPAAKPKTDLPAATKQAAAALAPVSSKRSAVIRGVDPNDFDAAFEEAAKL